MQARPTSRQRYAVLLLPLISVVGFLLCVAIDVRTPADTLGVTLAPGAGWEYAVNGVLLAGLATAVLLRDPRQRFGWALAALGVFWVLDGLAQSYVRFGLRADEALPGMTFVLWFLDRFASFLPVSLAVLLLIFPTGRLLPGRWGQAGVASLVAMVLAALALIVAPVPAGDRPDLPPGVDPSPTSVPLDPALFDWLLPVLFVGAVAGFLVAMASVVVRYRRSRGLERARMRWLLWGVLAMALAIALSLLVDATGLDSVLLFLVMALPQTAMTVAIINPRLLPIDELLARTLVYGGVSAAIVVVDLAALAALTTVLDDSLDQRQVVLVVLLLSAVLYGPLRQRLRTTVRRVMLGERDAPYDVVAGLATSLETADEGSGQLSEVARAVATAFGVSYVSVEVDRSNGERLIASQGERPAETRVLPITYRDVEVGRLVLPRHGLRARLSAKDERLLGDLVRQAAAAARHSQLAEELQSSRERLVVAREEERRRIRRDLHDGLGPALGGVVFRLESARLQIDHDPDVAKEHLAVTRDHVKDVVSDVRRLVHDLRPPALDDRGLVGALEQQAEAASVGGLRVVVEAGDLGRLAAATEVAAYRIASEALVNVTRHAGARHARIALRASGELLEVRVEDDGVGMAEATRAGVGLVSMRERAAELGGHTEVVCPETGGTVVTAWLPRGRTS